MIPQADAILSYKVVFDKAGIPIKSRFELEQAIGAIPYFGPEMYFSLDASHVKARPERKGGGRLMVKNKEARKTICEAKALFKNKPIEEIKESNHYTTVYFDSNFPLCGYGDIRFIEPLSVLFLNIAPNLTKFQVVYYKGFLSVKDQLFTAFCNGEIVPLLDSSAVPERLHILKPSDKAKEGKSGCSF